MISDREKKIYNLYLRASRVNRGKGFRYRQNWDGFEGSEDHNYVQNIDKTFKKFPHFFTEEFFDCPYKVFGDQKGFFNLKFYASAKAITTYVSFVGLRRNQEPDEQIEYIKDSLRFVSEFCLENKLFLKDYVDFKSVAQNDCLKHLKEHKVSWYVALHLPGFQNLLYNMPTDEFELYFGTNIDTQAFLNKLLVSKTAHRVVKKGIERVAEFLRNKLTSAVM